MASSGVLGATWGHLGPSWKRPGGVLGASGVRLRVSWGPLCPSCGRLVNVLGRLGRHLVLDFYAKKVANLGMPS